MRREHAGSAYGELADVARALGWATLRGVSGPDRRAVAGLHRTIPALPVRDVADAVVTRDDAVLHLWGATDDDWRSREDLDRQPVCSGAESFLAGTASCRIEVSDVDALFDELQSADVLHDVSRAGVTATDFGTREFATLDSDGNLLTFFRWNRR